jgi:hypothetical protein
MSKRWGWGDDVERWTTIYGIPGMILMVIWGWRSDENFGRVSTVVVMRRDLMRYYWRGRVEERLMRCRRYFMKLGKERRKTEDGNDVEQLERERVALGGECLHVED